MDFLSSKDVIILEKRPRLQNIGFESLLASFFTPFVSGKYWGGCIWGHEAVEQHVKTVSGMTHWVDDFSIHYACGEHTSYHGAFR